MGWARSLLNNKIREVEGVVVVELLMDTLRTLVLSSLLPAVVVAFRTSTNINDDARGSQQTEISAIRDIPATSDIHVGIT
jgi:hypothetical protein